MAVVKPTEENENTKEEAETRNNEVKKISVQFYTYAFASLLVLGTSASVSILQSSINIKDNVGTNALGMSKIFGSLTSLILAPIAIRRLGAKWSLVLGEAGLFLFILANVYPIPAIMLSVGVVRGIAGGFVWSAMPIYNIHFGKMRSQYSEKSEADYSNKYTGIFFAFLSLGQILAGFTSFAILESMKSSESSNLTDSFATSNGSQDNQTFGYETCGANDCQLQNITKQRIHRYVPTNLIALYSLLATFGVLILVGIGLHARFLQTINDEDEKSKKNQSIISTLKQTLSYSVSLVQVLLYPLLFYTGLQSAFVTTEMTRAYTSCVLGVEKIGLIGTAYDAAIMVSSVTTRRVIRSLGRNSLMGIAFLLDSGNMVFCLLWTPHIDTSWAIYVSLIAFGTTEAMWRNSSLDLYAEYFPKNKEISFSVWNVGVAVGLSLGYFWSPLLCVGTKLYIQCGLMGISAILYAIVEISRRSHVEPKEENSESGKVPRET